MGAVYGGREGDVRPAILHDNIPQLPQAVPALLVSQ